MTSEPCAVQRSGEEVFAADKKNAALSAAFPVFLYSR